jgi:hypothetical protein
VRSRRDGKVVYYALDDRHIRTLFKQGLAHTRLRAPWRPSPQAKTAGR